MPDPSASDIRDQLRADHATALAELAALRGEDDTPRCRERLARTRRAWMIHALAEETVVYRALEGAEPAAANDPRASDARADERFIEHELVEGLFDKLTRTRPGSLEWQARVTVARDLVARHIDAEHEKLFARLEQRFDAEELAEMGRRFRLAHDKLMLLEEAKAA